MAEFKNHNEQSMEEILAAIKNIMAEEGGLAPPSESDAIPEATEPRARNPAPHAAPLRPPEAVTPPPRLPPVQEAILDLTRRLDDDAPIAQSAGEPSKPAPSVAGGRLNRPPPLKTGSAPGESGGAGGRHASPDANLGRSLATLSRMASLAGTGRDSEPATGEPGHTLEETVRQLLRPQLKEWLDAHLPRMVERVVRDEINRLVREAQER
jgi:uncharacterized protein